MSLKDIRDTFGVPAFRGQRIRYKDVNDENHVGFEGVILRSEGLYLRIMRDGETYTCRTRFHPTWYIEYIKDKDSKKVFS